ncbi:hypothetical protein Bca4012_064906 [Brassica carinata]
MATEIEELKGMVRELAGKKKINGEVKTSETSAGFKEGVRVQILDWFESGDVVVGEGEFCSDEPMYKIGRVPIGPNAVAVVVKSALSSEASLWRPTTDVLSLEDAVGCKVAWPINKVLLDRNPVASQDVSMQHKDGDTQTCRIYDWTTEEEEVIAEGLVCSSNSKEMVNNISLGPNAVSIEVVKVFKDNAHLWMPTAEMFLIGDAINEKIAWPVLKFEIMATAATPTKPAATKTASPTKPAKKKAMCPGSTSSTRSAKQKCILFDCSNTGRKVAEGRVASTDPKELCHFVPLGPNASKVWVEVAKIGDAKVWRPNSEIECISDAIVQVQQPVNRNDDIEADRVVVKGRPLQKGVEVTLSDKDRDIAHRYVLMNMASMDPYVEMHLKELQANDARYARNETLLWKNHTEQFAEWIHSDSTNSHSKELRWLAFGPRNAALAHKGFIIKGQRFHTDAVKRKTQNSGEILLVDYHMLKVPLFRCNWTNTGNGVKEEDGFTLVNLHMNQAAYLKDPFILPSQAKQVFYSREDDNSNRYVVMRAPPRGYHELETEEDLGATPLPVQEVDDLCGEASDDDSLYVRDDCEGLLVVD